MCITIVHVSPFSRDASPMTPEQLNECFIAVMSKRCRYVLGAIAEDTHGVATILTQERQPSSFCVLSMPVIDATDFAARLEHSRRSASRSTVPWSLAVLHDWFDPDRDLPLLSQFAFRRTATVHGMWTSTLSNVRRPMPRLVVRRVNDADGLRPLVILNNEAYGIEPVTEDAVYRHYGLAPESCALVGYVNDEPVTCAAAFPTTHGTYLGAVATKESARGRGYAESICRDVLARSMQESGQSRALLLASPNRVGYYQAMGFEIGASWEMFRVFE